jgi:hypothetical protein
MKPLPRTDAERFDNAVRMTLIVAKEQMQRREAEWQKVKSKKSQQRKPYSGEYGLRFQLWHLLQHSLDRSLSFLRPPR